MLPTHGERDLVLSKAHFQQQLSSSTELPDITGAPKTP